jgi:hypothetical protein
MLVDGGIAAAWRIQRNLEVIPLLSDTFLVVVDGLPRTDPDNCVGSAFIICQSPQTTFPPKHNKSTNQQMNKQ